MEHWTVTKLQLLGLWGFPTLLIGALFGGIAVVVNALSGGAFAQVLGVVAIVLTTIYSTGLAVLMWFWVKAK